LSASAFADDDRPDEKERDDGAFVAVCLLELIITDGSVLISKQSIANVGVETSR
jgi:hypothetical protein